MAASEKEPQGGSISVLYPERKGRARKARKARTWVFLLSAVLLLVAAYVLMSPDAPNLPTPPEQSESAGRTAY
jgi:type VI protein secretion system component VasF